MTKHPDRYEWMQGDSPDSIGGRTTDIVQIALSLRRLVKEAFPMNAVPPQVVAACDSAELSLRLAEQELMRSIETISDACAKQPEES